MRQALRNHLAQFWATPDSAPRPSSDGDPPGGRGYVTTLPTCRPPLNLPPALKQGGRPRRQGIRDHLAQLRATSDCGPPLQSGGDPPCGGRCVTTLPSSGPPLILPPVSEALGTPQVAGVMLPPCPLAGHL